MLVQMESGVRAVLSIGTRDCEGEFDGRVVG